jgi:glycosyltransferase involved in cell wall biosynthesis
MKALRILGTRGVPAAHGGFETFAERLALHLVEANWAVTVYCQEDGTGDNVEDSWRGIKRVRVPVASSGPAGTIVFDWRATLHASRSRELCLTLGYNTAMFCALLRLRGVPNLINMDGIEWHRAKWGTLAKLWFWMNEHAGSRLGNQLVADHPAIAEHLARAVRASKITMIPYGAPRLHGLDTAALTPHGLHAGRYLTLIARPEPENSVLEVVKAFSARSRGLTLAVLGHYRTDHAYQCQVRAAASPEVRFLGAIYDPATVQALRLHSLAYVHGHQVGGTNPSLVEALGAGNAVIAHDNRFNRWVAQDAARYFTDAASACDLFDQLLGDDATLNAMRAAALHRHAETFTWPTVLQAYEQLLTDWLPAEA